MNGINIAKTIIRKRKEKGITQDELANYIGVSKPSVSKWETGQSYPDIVLLPQLASYFDISLDELMGYEPQMTSEDIDKLHKELINDFSTKPFDEVMERCREILKKYFSCFPLIYRIALLYMNYSLPMDKEQKDLLIMEAKKLLTRVKEQSNDIGLKQIALNMEATCELMLGNSNEIIELLKDVNPPPPHDVLLSQAYIMKGEIEKAKIELQRGMHFKIFGLFEEIPPYLMICAGETERFEEICRRAMELINLFNLKKLIPTTILPFYLAAAQGYLASNNIDKSLNILEEYTNVVTSDIYPLKFIKSDDFFDLIDKAAAELPFGQNESPRDEKSIKQDMANAVIANPVFTVLAEEAHFKSLTTKLIKNTGGK